VTKVIESKSDDSTDSQLQYEYGVKFTFYDEYNQRYPEYELVTAKYSNLKEELLSNEIKDGTVTIEQWDEMNKKVTGTAFKRKLKKIKAVSDPFWNRLMAIDAGGPMTEHLHHILAIKFYTDYDELPQNTKRWCRPHSIDEPVERVKGRYVEAVHWLKLLYETIQLFGGQFSKSSKPVYHGMDRRFLFRQFRARIFTPTSTSSSKAVAKRFTDSNGVIMQFRGFEFEGSRYFDTTPISRYPEENEKLFFHADLQMSMLIISDVHDVPCEYDLTPLLLYEAIVSGYNIVDKRMLKDNVQETLYRYLSDEDMSGGDEVQQYALNILRDFRNRNADRVRLNEEILERTLTFGKLREWIQENLKQDGNRKRAYHFVWSLDEEDYDEFKSDGNVASSTFECKSTDGDESIEFYLQLDDLSRVEQDDQREERGRIRAVLYTEKRIESVNFDLYCKKMKGYYVRFNDILFDSTEPGKKEDKEYQGEYFDLKGWNKALSRVFGQDSKDKKVGWEFTVSF